MAITHEPNLLIYKAVNMYWWSAGQWQVSCFTKTRNASWWLIHWFTRLLSCLHGECWAPINIIFRRWSQIFLALPQGDVTARRQSTGLTNGRACMNAHKCKQPKLKPYQSISSYIYRKEHLCYCTLLLSVCHPTEANESFRKSVSSNFVYYSTSYNGRS